ncbi:MAG TPA: hypothetical protein VMB71_14615, partial [Acetobacteraceae bacterium]|nr:hypothetical protein [Acetobacteraceae bacterium]
ALIAPPPVALRRPVAMRLAASLVAPAPASMVAKVADALPPPTPAAVPWQAPKQFAAAPAAPSATAAERAAATGASMPHPRHAPPTPAPHARQPTLHVPVMLASAAPVRLAPAPNQPAPRWHATAPARRPFVMTAAFGKPRAMHHATVAATDFPRWLTDNPVEAPKPRVLVMSAPPHFLVQPASARIAEAKPAPEPSPAVVAAAPGPSAPNLPKLRPHDEAVPADTGDDQAAVATPRRPYGQFAYAAPDRPYAPPPAYGYGYGYGAPYGWGYPPPSAYPQ